MVKLRMNYSDVNMKNNIYSTLFDIKGANFQHIKCIQNSFINTKCILVFSNSIYKSNYHAAHCLKNVSVNVKNNLEFKTLKRSVRISDIIVLFRMTALRIIFIQHFLIRLK